MEGKNLLKFRNKIHNFRNSIKFYMNFYRFKLAISRLKLTNNPDTRYIYFIFLEPRSGQDLHNEIYFIIFLLEFKSLQIFKVCSIFESKLKRNKISPALWAVFSARPSSTVTPRHGHTIPGAASSGPQQPSDSGQHARHAQESRAYDSDADGEDRRPAARFSCIVS
jgi:hypothetical protein